MTTRSQARGPIAALLSVFRADHSIIGGDSIGEGDLEEWFKAARVAPNRVNKRATGAIFADVGPKGEMGELSIRAAQLLGLKDNPKNGGTSRKKILYIVFPGSGNGKPRTADEIQTLAARLFADWGGDARVSALPNLV